jgi:hypothetical protein
VQEFLGCSPGPELAKGVTPQTPVRPLRVGLRPALWFGRAHTMSFVNAAGVTRGADMRLAGRTLVLMRDDITIRIGGAFDRRKAVEVARSFD